MEGTGIDVETVSVDEAALELGTTSTKILTMLRSRELAGEASGEGWRVSRRSLSCAKSHGIDRRQAPGCAARCKSTCGCG